MARLPWEMDNEQSTARQETWLLSFIDILALLLTLFVLLLAYQDRGTVDNGSKAVTAVQVLPEMFNLPPVFGVSLPEIESAKAGFAMPGAGLLPLPGQGRRAALAEQPTPAAARVQNVPTTLDQPVVTGNESGSVGEKAAVPADDERLPGEQDPAQPPTAEQHQAVVAVAPPAPLAVTDAGQPVTSGQAAEELLHSLRDSALGERVEVSVRPGAVNLEISDSILFPPASAVLSPAGLELLTQLAEILRTLPYSVSVEGHTDNVPIHTSRYPSNWELSSARAAMVTRKLIEQGVARERLRAIGYGDTRPRADNTSAAERAKNRRVTFVLQVEEPQ